VFYYNPFTIEILKKYGNWLELPDSVPIGFTGVAEQRPAPVYSNEVDADTLIWGFNVDFLATQFDTQIWIRSVSPQYEWMASQTATPQFTPIAALAGLGTQVMPVLPLIMPFFQKANGKLEMRFQNSIAAPITGGIITLRRLKLINPIDGGWNPGF